MSRITIDDLNENLSSVLPDLSAVRLNRAACQPSNDLEGAKLQNAFFVAFRNLANDQDVEAARAFSKILTIIPNHLPSLHNLGKALFKLGDIESATNLFRRAALFDVSGLSLSALAAIIPGDPRAGDTEILDIRKSWVHFVTEKLKACPMKHKSHPKADRKLRIGYVSSFFNKENWMKPVWGLINNHDRSRYEIYLFADVPESQFIGYQGAPSDTIVNIYNFPLKEAADRILRNRIDILVDLNGYSAVDRLPLYLYKPAPLILGWFNMFGTSGLDCFDYLIADEYVISRSEEVHYVEKIRRVDGSYLTFTVGYPVPPVSEPPCISNGYITFGSLAPLYKIIDGVVEAWSQILHRVPSSQLLIKNAQLSSFANQNHLLKKFLLRKISPDRLIFSGPSNHYDFLNAYMHIDIALDTFPYNGGTTTSEALWQGVPVIAFPGSRWVSRTSTSILKAARMDECIAADMEDYIEKAVVFATRSGYPVKLRELRMNMRENLRKSSITDCSNFALNMERTYNAMWLRHSSDYRQLTHNQLPWHPGYTVHS